MNAIALRKPRVLSWLVLACAAATAGCSASDAKKSGGTTCASASCATVGNPTATGAGTVPASPGATTTPAAAQAGAPGVPSGTAGAAMTSPSASAGAPATMPPPAGTTQPPTMTTPPPAGSSGCGAATWPAAGDKMIDVGGTQREYISAIPSDYNPNTPYKLIFAWHGLGGSAKQVAGGFGYGYYGLQQLAGNTAIFVAGQGLDTGISIGANGMPMNGMGGSGGTMPPAGSSAGWLNTNDQDIAFVKAMLDELRKSYCIDDKRIFSVGMSFGGIMSNTVGCELGGVFRAIAPMSGSGPRVGFGGSAACMGQVAVWIAHGNMDMTVPFSSGQASRDYWVKANHCTTDTMAVDPMGCLLYQGCDAGFPVTFCEFSGGHTIWQPSTQAIWKFFSQF